MATKAELEEALEAEKRSAAALKGQITKLQGAGDSGELREAVSVLLDAIDRKGLSAQIGNRKEVSTVRALIEQ